jgi:hypothetical protein
VKTINKHQLYRFCKNRNACQNGLKRLRQLIRGPKTAREILEKYRTHAIDAGMSSPILEFQRGRDYRWLAGHFDLTFLNPSQYTVQDLINRISERK